MEIAQGLFVDWRRKIGVGLPGLPGRKSHPACLLGMGMGVPKIPPVVPESPKAMERDCEFSPQLQRANSAVQCLVNRPEMTFWFSLFGLTIFW